jgi:CheY-like chemotaxis protein
MQGSSAKTAATPARIVVVEDNSADIGLLRMALNDQGEEYDLVVLNTGEEALRFVREHRTGIRGQEPCVIILDLHLPQYDGLEILQAVRQVPVLEHIKVIVLSGSASPDERREIDALGAVYREKPFVLQDFMVLGAEIFALCKNEARAAA